MSDRLWQHATPRELSESAQTVEFSGRVSDFERLSEALGKGLSVLGDDAKPLDWSAAAVTGTLACRPASLADAALLDGEASARVDVVCQRCLAPMEVILEASLRYALGQDIVGSLDGYEAWEFEGLRVRLADLVDENLVLALPMVARHDDADCHAESESSDEATETRRPFAALRRQMEQDEH